MNISENRSDFFKKLDHTLANWAAYIAGICIFTVTILITIGALGRYLFNFNIIGVDEMSAYMLIITTYLGFAYALHEDAHISIRVVVDRFNAKINEKISLITLFVCILIVVIYLNFALDALIDSIKKGERALTVLQTPLWILRIVICSGWVIFFISLVRLFIEKIIGFKYKKES